MAAHAQHLLKWKYFSFIAVYCVASDVTVMQYRGGPLSQSGASLHCARPGPKPGGGWEWHQQLRSSTPQTGALSATGRAGLQPGGRAACPAPGQVNTSRAAEMNRSETVYFKN